MGFGGRSLFVVMRLVGNAGQLSEPLPPGGGGVGERGMESRDFAKSLRNNMTDAEHFLWRRLRANRLCGQKFRRQHPIGPYIVDFVHLGAKLVVEADGGQHADSAPDRERDAWLADRGYRVMRFWNDQILWEPEAVLKQILSVLQVSSPSPPTPLPPGERGATPTRVED